MLAQPVIYSAYPDITDGLPEQVDINGLPSFPHAAYEVTVAWDRIEAQLQFFAEYGLNIDPDFQREHVWTPQQQTAYIEYVLMGGELSKVLYFAVKDWNALGLDKQMVLMDGKQRLEAVRAFLRNEVFAFRRTFKQLGGRLRMTKHCFQWRVVDVATRADVLKLYLALNAGGTPHAPEEIAKVQSMLAAEMANPTDPPPPVKKSKKAKPVCAVCRDTHLMQIRVDGKETKTVMCTHCPVPCDACRLSGKGPYCGKTPCACDCHKKGAK